MLKKVLDGDRPLIIAVLAVLLAMCAGSYGAYHYLSGQLLREDARSTAQNWATYLSDFAPGLEEVVAGADPDAETLAFFRNARHAGRIYRYRIFDHRGRLVFQSEQAEFFDPDGEPGLASGRRDELAPVILEGETLTAVRESASNESRPDPALFSETFVPLLKDGHILGMVQVFTDQTENASLYGRAALVVTGVIALLTLLAVSLLGSLFSFKSRKHQEAQREIAFLAEHEPLTKLPNRVYFRDRLEHSLACLKRDGTSVAVCYIGLDRFKEVNDTLGHATGDKLLKAVAERLNSNIREIDTVARIGGDVFAIIQISLRQPEDAQRLVRRLHRLLRTPFYIGGQEIPCTASMGVAIGPVDGDDADYLMRNAEVALYQAKADGPSSFRFFEAEMDSQLQERRALERDLRKALDLNEFALVFQPQYQVAGGELAGFEVLLRWPHPTRGMVSPAEFIPIAEESGLIGQIGEWVLRQSCNVAVEWPKPVKVSVNLSPAQFKYKDVVDLVASALAQSGLPAERLELEITESLLMRDTNSSLDILKRLQDMGVSVAMDDFGTGYSSLSYLWRFTFDKIKIDRSFMPGLQPGSNVASIVQSIIDLGRSLNVVITAEGVETAEQTEYLKHCGCDQVQGYLFGRPMSLSKVHELLRSGEVPALLAAPAIEEEDARTAAVGS